MNISCHVICGRNKRGSLGEDNNKSDDDTDEDLERSIGEDLGQIIVGTPSVILSRVRNLEDSRLTLENVQIVVIDDAEKLLTRTENNRTPIFEVILNSRIFLIHKFVGFFSRYPCNL